MSRPQHYFDWHSLIDEQAHEPVANSRERVRWILVCFAICLTIVFARAVQLELSDGAEFRRLAALPLKKTVPLGADRGRILARDGTVLAADRPSKALTIQFRYLQSPPDADWLRRLVRSRLPRADRRKPERVAAMEVTVLTELAQMRVRLAAISQMSAAQWQARTRRIQGRVEAIAGHVNERRMALFSDRLASEDMRGEFSLGKVLGGLFAPPETLPPRHVTIAEELAYHRVVDAIGPEVIREIESNADTYPGVKIVDTTRREYPLQSLAAHLVGHVGSTSSASSMAGSPPSAGEVDGAAGLMGAERQFQTLLRGTAGLEARTVDHRGKLLTSSIAREPVAGSDVVLTIDPRLQLSAEQALDRARRREKIADHRAEPLYGGAIVVMDVQTGEILAAASAPRFDPNLFAAGDSQLEAVLRDPSRPLFDRVAKMALSPGSVFKPATALALLASHVVDASEAFACQGYLNDPERQRCQIFRQFGIGHGDVSLADALAQSCNVYFYHHAADLGSARLVDWTRRFGFGQRTGVLLPDEATGQLPTSDHLHKLSETQAFAVGQGAFTATPLQVVRLYAAIANGGYLITPRIVLDGRPREGELSESDHIAGLSASAIESVRAGLRRVVEDPNGTAYATVRMPSLAIAGKTGTAETGGQLGDHAWFAGYAPAESPRYAFVVTLEHAGSGSVAAGAVAKSLLQRMQQLNYFGAPAVAQETIPPGRG